MTHLENKKTKNPWREQVLGVNQENGRSKISIEIEQTRKDKLTRSITLRVLFSEVLLIRFVDDAVLSGKLKNLRTNSLPIVDLKNKFVFWITDKFITYKKIVWKDVSHNKTKQQSS